MSNVGSIQGNAQGNPLLHDGAGRLYPKLPSDLVSVISSANNDDTPNNSKSLSSSSVTVADVADTEQLAQLSRGSNGAGTPVISEAGKAVDFHSDVIESNKKRISNRLQYRKFFQIVKVITAILAIASALILAAAFIALPFAAIIALILVTVFSVMMLAANSIDAANNTGHINSSKDRILVAKILKEIYSNSSVKDSFDPEDEEFNKMSIKIQELLSNPMPAGCIYSQDLLSALKSSSTSKEDIDVALRKTLLQCICKGDYKELPELVIQSRLSSQFFKHVDLFLKASSKEQIAKLLLETENNPQLADAEETNDKNGVFA